MRVFCNTLRLVLFLLMAAVPAYSQSNGTTLERNISQPDGSFTIFFTSRPGVVNAGERVRLELKIIEKMQGGFNTSFDRPVEDATLRVKLHSVSEIRVPHQRSGLYTLDHSFNQAGNHSLQVLVSLPDQRKFDTTFPITITGGRAGWALWSGLIILVLISTTLFVSLTKLRPQTDKSYILAASLLLFAAGASLLYYVVSINSVGAREVSTREKTSLTFNVPKETQLLFGIKTAPVTHQNISSELKVNGRIKARPEDRAIISAPQDGRILLNKITLGSSIGRGQQIGQVVPVLGATERVELQVQSAEVREKILDLETKLAEQKVALEKERAHRNHAVHEVDRLTKLATLGAVSTNRLNDAIVEARIAESEFRSHQEQITLIENQLKEARKLTGSVRSDYRTAIQSPINGVVSEIKVTNGQTIQAGTEILSLVNLNSVLIEANVFEKDLPAIRGFTRASYRATPYPDEVYRIGEEGHGRVVLIGQGVDPATGAVPVIFEVPNPVGKLRDGMMVEVSIETGQGAPAAAVSPRAVVAEGGAYFVYLYHGGEKFEKRNVVIGARSLEFWEIKSGLTPGDRVVIDGVHQLRS
jgi:RND family efflux transporter MFP subunit